MKAFVLGSVALFGLALAVYSQTPPPEATPVASIPVATPSVAPTATVLPSISPAATTSPVNDFAERIKQRAESGSKHKKGFNLTIDDDDGDKSDDSDGVPHWVGSVAILGILAVFGTPVLIVGLIMYFSMSRSRALQRTVRMMVEKGQPVPPELLASPAAAPLRPWYDLRRGIILFAVGIAITIFFGMTAGWDEGVWALGLIPGLIGLGYILVWRLANKHQNGFKL